MAKSKSEPMTAERLKAMGMVEVAPGIYQKVAYKIRERDGTYGQEFEKDKIQELKSLRKREAPFCEGYRGKKNNLSYINVKPLSVNEAWKGRRFKTNEYKQYEKEVLGLLPYIILPEPPYKIVLIFGVSNMASDFDNPCKPIVDILQKKYEFNDKHIMEAHITKQIVKKGQEFVAFEIKSI